MNKEDHYPMSQKQLGRYVTISRLSEGQITTEEAANYLGLSTRQILRLKIRSYSIWGKGSYPPKYR